MMKSKPNCIVRFAGSVLIAVGALVNVESAQTKPKIAPWPENPWYWSMNGEPVTLIGGSDDDNLFQWPADLLIPQLNRIQQAGGNVIRNTMSDRPDKGFEVYPYLRLDAGKYDLDQWNSEYWERFQFMLKETARRGIVVQIEVWDRFDYTDVRQSNWKRHPYNPDNNINYTTETSGLNNHYPAHPGANQQPFFFTTPKQRNNELLLSYQNRFVEQMLEISLEFDHVLYCMDNETKAEPEWGAYWANKIKGAAVDRCKTVYVTEMWDAWNLRSDEHKATFDHPELYDFVDVSQNNHNSGQKHWDNFLYVREYLASQPRPMNTTKTYGATGNKFGHNDQDAVERVWRHLLAGAASVRFHRPDSGLGIGEKAFNCIRAARMVNDQAPFWSLTPWMEGLSEREENEAYAAKSEDGKIVVYFTGNGSVLLDLTESPGEIKATWISIDKGIIHRPWTGTGGAWVNLSSPGKGNWVWVKY